MAITMPASSDAIRPLEGAVIRRFTAGTGGTTGGYAVTNAPSGVISCDGNGAANKRPIGIAIQTRAAGETVDVVVFGAVGGYSGITIGAEIYPADATDGLPSETASTNKYSVGQGMASDKVFVNPGYIA